MLRRTTMHGRKLHIEPLEARQLLSAVPSRLEIPPNNDSAPGNIAAVGGVTFFSADDGIHGRELWKTDGTQAGTVLVKDINTGLDSSSPRGLTNVNGTLFFKVIDNFAYELWKSDGTEAGTVLVKDVEVGAMVDVNGTLFFNGSDAGQFEFELWKSDGTEAGTVKVKDLDPGPTFGPGMLTNANGTLFFGFHGELWKSDGSEAGTVLVKDIRPGPAEALHYTDALTNVNGTLFFQADDGTNGRELWKSDGTEAGTVRVKDIVPGSGSSYPRRLANFNGELVFTVGDELWKSDGTDAGTVLVKDVQADFLTTVGGSLFFVAKDLTHGYELWKSDGTFSGTTMVKDIWPGVSSSLPFGGISRFTNVNGTLFFMADEGTHGNELWKSDGSETGTVRVKDIYTGVSSSFPNPPASSFPDNLLNVNGALLFSADDGLHGVELWKSDGSDAGTALVRDINKKSPESSSSKQFTDVGGVAFFTANYPRLGQELFKSDGTEAGTVMVKDIRPGFMNSGAANLTNVGGTLFFTADDGIHGRELWKSDGTDAGTTLVHDIRPDSDDNPYLSPSSLTNVDGTLFFTANDSVNGAELWKSDGTEAGTVLVKDILPGGGGAAPASLTNVNGTLFFTANNGSDGYELWKSNGTEAGTVLVKDVNPGINSSASWWTSLMNVNGTLFFAADDGANGAELWKSDGTEVGTVMVKDIAPGTHGYQGYYQYYGPYPNSSLPGALTNFNGMLIFTAEDGVTGRELWASDGTEAGTIPLKDINPGGGSSFGWYPAPRLLPVGETLFFAADDGAHGTELWRSNGTTAGTVMVKDIDPGTNGFYDFYGQYHGPYPVSSGPGGLTNVNGALVFAASNGAHGRELWQSDGTEAGTTLVHDIRPGSGNSDPNYLTNVNGTLFFAANDGVNGTDPMVLRVDSAVVGQRLFYKGSSQWNVTNANLPGFSDDNAIAPDKTAYLPGSGTSAFSAVSSYTKGINGLMIDLAGAHGALTADDFIFKVGNNNSPSTWATAPAPTTVTVRSGAGGGGSDRVELLWADNAIENTWLEVIVKGNDALGGSNTNTGLASSYVFYFGSAPADSGAGNATGFLVNSSDEVSARNDPHSAFNRASITNVNDFNRDGQVNSSDQVLARNRSTSVFNQLTFLSVGAGGPFAPLAEQGSAAAGAISHATGDRGIAAALASAQQTDPPTPASGSTLAPVAITHDPPVVVRDHRDRAIAEESVIDSLDSEPVSDAAEVDDDLLNLLLGVGG